MKRSASARRGQLPSLRPPTHQRVDALQPRFERAPDGDAAVGAGRRLDHLAGPIKAAATSGHSAGGELERARRGDERAQKSASFSPASPRVEAGQAAVRVAAKRLERQRPVARAISPERPTCRARQAKQWLHRRSQPSRARRAPRRARHAPKRAEPERRMALDVAIAASRVSKAAPQRLRCRAARCRRAARPARSARRRGAAVARSQAERQQRMLEQTRAAIPDRRAGTRHPRPACSSAAGGVRASGVPPESSARMPKRSSSVETRRASSRSAVTRAAVLPPARRSPA